MLAGICCNGDEDENSDEESEDFKFKEDEKKKDPENYFIGAESDEELEDIFTVSVDELFSANNDLLDNFTEEERKSDQSSSCDVQSSHEFETITSASMSSRDMQRAYVL